MKRVILVDPGGMVAAVREGLGETSEIEIVQAERLPDDRDAAVALLVAPEIPVGAAELERLPAVRIVAATATGFDHLDLEAITAANAWATHCPGYCDQEVAEHAIAFTLDLLRGLTLLDRSVRAGQWNELEIEPQRIAGSVLGIVGLGRIGREVARRGQALGMRVIASDPLVKAADAGSVELMALDGLL